MYEMGENVKEVSRLLKVLSSENRLLILCALIGNPLTVTEISESVCNISQSALSQHLSILKANGILTSEKKGQKVTYLIKDERVVSLIKVLKESYCQNI